MRNHAAGEFPLAFFTVDIAPFQEFCCLTIKLRSVHQRTESHQEAIGFFLLDFTQLRGETGDDKKRISVVVVISTYNICFYYVGQIFKSEEQEKIYIIILLYCSLFFFSHAMSQKLKHLVVFCKANTEPIIGHNC